MVFEILHDAAKRGELLLVEGGLCHFHIRRDGQLTVREIISVRKGAGSLMLGMLRSMQGVKFILARCPADLDANSWYQQRGFQLRSTFVTKTGRVLNEWVLAMESNTIEGDLLRGK